MLIIHMHCTIQLPLQGQKAMPEGQPASPAKAACTDSAAATPMGEMARIASDLVRSVFGLANLFSCNGGHVNFTIALLPFQKEAKSSDKYKASKEKRGEWDDGEEQMPGLGEAKPIPLTREPCGCDHDKNKEYVRLTNDGGYFKENYLKNPDNLWPRSCVECGIALVDKPKSKVQPGKEYKVSAVTPVHACKNAAKSHHPCIHAFCDPCRSKSVLMEGEDEKRQRKKKEFHTPTKETPTKMAPTNKKRKRRTGN